MSMEGVTTSLFFSFSSSLIYKNNEIKFLYMNLLMTLTMYLIFDIESCLLLLNGFQQFKFSASWFSDASYAEG